MRAFCNIPTLLLLACSLTTACYAQPQRFRFEHFSVADGLPNNSVRRIVQDERGLLWMTTDNGLVKYDGYNMTAYRPAPDSGFLWNQIGVIHIDQKEDLWMGNCSGILYRFDRKTERFTPYQIAYYPSPDRSMCVSIIHEDRAGNLWVIREAGERSYDMTDYRLDRFGRESGAFTHIRHDPADPYSLSHDKVFALHEDAAGRLYVGTTGGLNRFDPDTGHFTRFRHRLDDPQSISSDSVLAIYEAPSEPGRLYVGTAGGGLNRFDPDTGRFTRFRHNPNDPQSISSDSVLAITEDRAGRLWVGTRRGLCRMDRATGRFERYLRHPERPGDPGNSVRFIFEDRHGVLWLKTTETAGIDTKGAGSVFPTSFGGEAEMYSFEPATGTFASYPYDSTKPGSLRGGRIALDIYEDRQDILWIGTFLNGVNKLDRGVSPFTTYRYDLLDPEALHSKYVRIVYEAPSRPGVLWVGATDGHVYRFDRAEEAFTRVALGEDLGGRPRRDAGTVYDEGGVSAIYEAPSEPGVLYVGTWGRGLYRFDMETETILQHYRHDPRDTSSLSHDYVEDVLEDRNGVLWIGTHGGGLNRLDRLSGRFRRYRDDPENPQSLGDDVILALHEGHEGTLWIADNKQLTAYDPKTDGFRRYSTGGTPVTSLFEDPTGRLWVGTYTGGLYVLDRSRTSFSPVTNFEPGASLVWIGALLGDEAGHLWLGTQNGLWRYDPDTGAHHHYDVSDGLPGREFVDSPVRTASGEFFFGGENGFFSFYPDEVVDNPYVPPVVLTGFKLFNEPVPIGADAPLKAHVSLAEEITLRHDQNDFTLEFAALNFRNTEKNQYRYRLEPFEADWREAGTRREAAYTNMSPGMYTFRVQGSNNDGVWNEEGASLRITILPPWWRSWWAYALYALLLVGAAMGAFRVQRGRLLRQAEVEQARLRAEAAESRARAMEAENERSRVEVEKARELETAYTRLKTTQQQLVQSEKLASLGQLTSGIAHELKNPLNFVNNFAEVNEELARELKELITENRERRIADVLEDLDDIASGVRLNSKHIAQHGRRADAIVRSMMEHAVSASGERYPVAINAFVEEYMTLSYHGMQARVPGLEVEIARDYGDAVGNVEVAPQELGRALLNVLGNAFEAVHEKAETGRRGGAEDGYVPVVRVSTRRDGDTVEIRIADNGPGIDQELREKIFEPFFTTKPTGGGNTGLGLSLAYDIISQGHGGTLTVESAEGEDATFIITLPS